MSMPEAEAQATSLKNSWKFVSAERLPRIDAKTTFQQVYSQLSRSRCSGFLVSALGQVKGYVKANELAEKVIQYANGDTQLLRTYSNESIGDLIMKFVTPPVPVRDVPGDATEEVLRGTEDTVFSVTEREETVGWYLNHETLRDAATKRTVFICVNDHRNPDPDHGKCYECPFPIVRTETE